MNTEDDWEKMRNDRESLTRRRRGVCDVNRVDLNENANYTIYFRSRQAHPTKTFLNTWSVKIDIRFLVSIESKDQQD